MNITHYKILHAILLESSRTSIDTREVF